MISKVILINGKPCSGKDTFIDIVAEVLSDAEHTQFGAVVVDNISTVDSVKLAAKQLGWDGQKTDEWRSILHGIKAVWAAEVDGPVRELKRKLMSRSVELTHYVVFVHVREPAEISRYVDELDYPVTTLLLQRGNAEDASNFGDQNANNYVYDFTITNEDTGHWRETLRTKAETFLTDLWR